MKKEEKLEFFGLERAQFNYFPIIASLGALVAVTFICLPCPTESSSTLDCVSGTSSSPAEHKFPLQPKLSSQFLRLDFCTLLSFTCSFLTGFLLCFFSDDYFSEWIWKGKKISVRLIFAHFTLHGFQISSWAPLVFAPSPHFRCCALDASTVQPRRFCEMSLTKRKNHNNGEQISASNSSTQANALNQSIRHVSYDL